METLTSRRQRTRLAIRKAPIVGPTAQIQVQTLLLNQLCDFESSHGLGEYPYS